MSLPITEPIVRPQAPLFPARTGKSPVVILRRGAELLRQHGRPVAESSELDTLAEVCERSVPGHYKAYGQTCLDGITDEAKLDD